MHSPDVSRRDLIDAYLRKRLSGAELETFELRLLEDDELFEQVQQAEAMHEAFKAERVVADRSVPPQDSGASRHWLRQPLSMAAALALCVSLALNVLLIDGSAEEGAPGILAVNSFAVLGTLRGGGDAILVEGSAPYLLQIDVGLLAAPESAVRLRDGSGRTVFQQEGLSSPDGWLRVVIGGRLSGPHVLEVRGGENAQEYQLDFSD